MHHIKREKTEDIHEDTGVTCECGGQIYRDQVNRGVVTRCRNPACPVDEVILPAPVVLSEEVE